MGDRANIVLKDGDTAVYLYTHWNGYRIEAIAAAGLRAAISAGRVTDTAYGGRIVTGVFLAEHADDPYLGAGISAQLQDGRDHMVVIDFATQQVTYGRPHSVSITEFVQRFPA